MLKNTATTWGSVSKSLHWGLVILALIQVPLGVWLSREAPQARITGDDTVLLWLEQFHHSFGFVILFVVITRLWWRLRSIVPSHPAGLPAYQVRLASITHGALYVLMVAFPLSGWAASSVIGSAQFPVPINFFGAEMIPLAFLQSLQPPYSTFALYRDIHVYCWWVGAGLLSLHILAALYHHFVLKTNVLKRMWPF